MFRRQALSSILLTFALSLGTQGAHAAGPARANKAAKPAKLAVKNVRQKDGSVMVRLDLKASTLARKNNGKGPSTVLPAIAAEPADSPLAKQAQLMDQWLDAVTEPRIMTALAAVAIEPGADTRTLHKTLDPASVRNWAEFVDPELFLRWQSSNLDPKFNPAIHNRTEGAWMLPRGIVFPINFPIPPEFQAGAPLKPTLWSNAYGTGPGGREAAEAWLKLPLPDARSNPWLRPGQHYRY